MDLELILEQMPVVIHSLNIGFVQTLKLFSVTLIGALPLGLIIAFGSMSRFKPLSWLCRFIVWIIRGTPLMIQLLIIYYFPGLVLNNNIWGSGESGRFIASAAAFIFNYACYFSEIYRGGIQSVPKGQQEAGLVLGMTKTQIFFRVTLLQMIKRIVPPISNEVITLVKDTSLSTAIAVSEMFLTAKNATSSSGSVEPLFIAGLFYLLMNTLVTCFFDFLIKRFDYYHD